MSRAREWIQPFKSPKCCGKPVRLVSQDGGFICWIRAVFQCDKCRTCFIANIKPEELK